ncbi:MAG: sigma 54-interacting transcriptional regulator [Acidaminococcaceae bacterium]|jgi:DNA-binding NtrC family response regulator|nr:sigma 54-interacting transcriptional regulator [Acidaminococcaceae bacterium]MCI2109359.1 sigma 54-interacting transcriptional regulator [Acidaminococcaceae bacterium]
MIREKRNKEKLTGYYNKFIEEGILDPNVHPWIAESWQRCAARKQPHETLPKGHKLTREQVAEQQKLHQEVINYTDGLFEQNKQHFNSHNLSMLLIDENGYVIKNYALPFYQRSIDDIQGMRVLEEDVGTSSISIARGHDVPFLMFGPEMWIRECHSGDACSAPIDVNGKIRYIIAFFSLDQNDLPYDMLLAILLTMKYSLEQFLTMLEYWTVFDVVAAEMPVSIYWLNKNGTIRYCNPNGKKRLGGKDKMDEVFLNYEHLPIDKALGGKATLRKEITWITQDRTYEDVTSVMPVRISGQVDSVVILSMAIEDLKTTIAHATGYNSRYSLYSMVGNSAEFLALQHKAARVARSDNNILLQGEPGTGKQRLAHGIHQASPRAAAPLITIRCQEGPMSALEDEFFGSGDPGSGSGNGKLALANGGTLFLDEIEKLPVAMGDKVADAIINGIVDKDTGRKRKLNVRIIAACDSNLKRLTDKGLFSANLYAVVLGTTMRVIPLRERKEDVEIIANHILTEMAARHNMPAKKLAQSALNLLNNCTWPGNIKQLQGVIEQAFFHTAGGNIEAENIKLPGDKTMEKSWKHDKEAFIAVWKQAGGNISKLATMLDVSRVTLYRYLKKYNLGPEKK